MRIALFTETYTPYINGGGAFVTASTSEMFSISMLEAQSTGLPAFVRHDPYNDCQIKEGFNGFVYHDSAEFGSLIRAHFEKSPEDIKAFSEGVVQSVAGYGVRELAEKVLEVYRYAQRRHKLTQSSKRKAFLVTPVAVHIGKRKNDASDKNEAER